MGAKFKNILLFFPDNKSPYHFFNKASLYSLDLFLANTHHAKSIHAFIIHCRPEPCFDTSNVGGGFLVLQIVRGSESHMQSKSCIEGQNAFTCSSNAMKSSKMMFEILQSSYQHLPLVKKCSSRFPYTF